MAADKFRAAFDTAIVRLEKEPGCHRNILASEFDRHEQATIIFMNYLGGERNGFRKAWDKYKAYAIQQTNVSVIAFIGTEVDSSGNNVSEKRNRECLCYIKELLDYAKPKE